jgi:4-hydroxy-tetrahydrodipicolinate reductase
MNIALIGYGQMGREIEREAQARGHKISAVVKIGGLLKNLDFSLVDVAIDFTQPDAVVQNIKILAEKGISTVVGTTGWYKHLPEVKEIIAGSQIGFLWSANFSLGMHLFCKIIEQAAVLVNQLPEYDVFALELHHKNKKDSPSGTARIIAQILLDHLDRKERLVTNKLDRPPKPQELHFSSTRGGSVPGTHSVYFDSPADTIEIIHRARSRAGFAVGAVQAAEWLKGKVGYYEMEDFVKDILT